MLLFEYCGIRYKYKLTDFNEEYYDLYWETNMSRVNAFFNFFVFGLAICSYVDDLVKLSFEQGLAVDTSSFLSPQSFAHF